MLRRTRPQPLGTDGRALALNETPVAAIIRATLKHWGVAKW